MVHKRNAKFPCMCGRFIAEIHFPCSTVILFTRAATLCLLILMTFLLWLRQASAAPVSVRFVEGVTHGFLVLRTVNGELIASGDLLQGQRGGQVQSRMVFPPRAQSVPLALVTSASTSTAAAAISARPQRAAASATSIEKGHQLKAGSNDVV